MKFFKPKAKDSKTKKGRLDKILKGVEVPAFSQVTLRILSKVRSPDSSSEEVADALQWDPPLVIRVLRTVNSAAYGVAREIQDVRHAANFLGRSQLEQLVLTAAVKQATPARPAPGFDTRRHWRTAAARASLARQFAARLHPARQAESFTIGLLQDMALPILASAHAADYADVLKQWHGQGTARLDELEKEVFGWTHAEVGGLLAERWDLPQTLSGAIHDHHRTDRTDGELLPAVKLVSVLRETEAACGIEALVALASDDYGLTSDWTRSTVEESDRQAEELAELLAA